MIRRRNRGIAVFIALVLILNCFTTIVYGRKNEDSVNNVVKDDISKEAEPQFIETKLTDEEIEESYYPEGYLGYRYPVLPGTSAWPYGNYMDMIDSCRIPEELLENMSTEELFQTALVHPLILMAQVYENSGFEIVKSYCSCLRELCDRQDRVECMYEYLANHREEFVSESLSKGNDYLDYISGRYKMVFFFLADIPEFYPEGIIDSEEVLSYINSVLQCEKGIEKEINRDPYPISFSGLVSGDNTNTEVAGVEGYSSTTAYTVHEGSLPAVLTRAKERWLYSDGVYRNRTLYDFTSSAKNAMKNEMYGTYGLYPDTNYEASALYNCHNYAWCKDNYKYLYWVNGINAYGYTTTTMQNVNIGGIVAYYYSYGDNIGGGTLCRHSAVVIGKYYTPYYGLNLRSKWAQYGVYSHTISNCPYYYYPDSSYTCDRMYYNP